MFKLLTQLTLSVIESLVVFNFSVTLFLLLPVELICSQVHILKKLVFLWYPVTENRSVYEVRQVRSLFCEIRSKASFQNIEFCTKLYMMDKAPPQKKEMVLLCSFNILMTCIAVLSSIK